MEGIEKVSAQKVQALKRWNALEVASKVEVLKRYPKLVETVELKRCMIQEVQRYGLPKTAGVHVYNSGGSGSVDAEDYIAKLEEQIRYLEDAIFMVDCWLETLSDANANLIRGRYMQMQTEMQMAAKMQMSPSWVHCKCKSLLENANS